MVAAVVGRLAARPLIIPGWVMVGAMIMALGGPIGRFDAFPLYDFHAILRTLTP